MSVRFAPFELQLGVSTHDLMVMVRKHRCGDPNNVLAAIDYLAHQYPVATHEFAAEFNTMLGDDTHRVEIIG